MVIQILRDQCRRIFALKSHHALSGVPFRHYYQLQRHNPMVTDGEKSYFKRNYRKTLYQKIDTLTNAFPTHRSPAFVLDDCSPEDVARALIEGGRQREPFYLFHMDEAYNRIQHFLKRMPRVQVFYAVKANDDDMFLKLCLASGLGFDCASPGEINKVRRLYGSPRIIYAAPTKTAEQMSFARASRVKHTTFDSLYELKKIKHNWPDARLLLRIRVDGESVYKLGIKFGCDYETEAVGLLEEAARLGLSVMGVAFHVGSACTSTDCYVQGLRWSKALFEHEARAGRRMTIVDFGGGFMGDSTDRIDKVAELVNEALEEYFPDPDIQVVAEPGRYLCDSAYTLYCNINNVREVVKNGKRTNMLYLNDGIYGTLRFPEPWHTVRRFKKSSDRDTEILEDVILWGPSCDSTDRVMADFPLQLPRCTPDDWLVFTLQGAYNLGFSTRFSCLSVPLIRPVVSSELWSRLRQTDAFSDEEFTVNPDISSPLPSTLPPLLSTIQ